MFRVALATADPPQVVVDEKGVEHLGADVEGIMGFEPRVELGRVAAQHGARQQHAERLAADGTAADHARPHRKQVVEPQVFVDQARHRRIAREHQAAQPREPFLFGGVGKTGASCRRHCFRGGELSCPVTDEGAVLQPRPLRIGKDFRYGAAVAYRAETVTRLPGVDQIHRGRRTMLDLDRPQVELFAAAEDVDEKLRGIGDHPDGRRGMAVAEHAEIGDGIQIKQARTGQTEEIAQHAVRLPGVGQIRQAVEHVERLAPCRLDDRVDLIHESVETLCRVGTVRFHCVQQGRMIGEAEINQVQPGGASSGGIRFDQGLVLV